MAAPYCAECESHVSPDSDHVIVQAEERKPHDPNAESEFMFHPECWREVSDEWMQPA